MNTLNYKGYTPLCNDVQSKIQNFYDGLKINLGVAALQFTM